MVDTGNGGKLPDAGVGADKPKRKVFVKKRKKRLGINCDKNCPACRVPCETPLFPTTRKPR